MERRIVGEISMNIWIFQFMQRTVEKNKKREYFVACATQSTIWKAEITRRNGNRVVDKNLKKAKIFMFSEAAYVND